MIPARSRARPTRCEMGPLDGSGPSVKVNASLPAGGGVQTDFVALDDGTLYRADQEENDVFELFLDQ